VNTAACLTGKAYKTKLFNSMYFAKKKVSFKLKLRKPFFYNNVLVAANIKKNKLIRMVVWEITLKFFKL